MPETMQPAAAPDNAEAQSPKRRRWVVAAAILAALVVAGGVAWAVQGHNATGGADASPSPAAATFPLAAHYGTIEGYPAPVCDPSSARAWFDGNKTVTVLVDLPSPGTVQVWIQGNTLNGNLPLHLTQQVTKRGLEAQFTTWVAGGEPIKVAARSENVSGTCVVVPQQR